MAERHDPAPMLLDGVHHVALLTSDTDRLIEFYQTVFGATVEDTTVDGPVRLTFLNVGPNTELNVFEINGNDQAAHQTPMFGRGRLDAVHRPTQLTARHPVLGDHDLQHHTTARIRVPRPGTLSIVDPADRNGNR